MIGEKPLRIIDNKVDGFFRDYGGIKYLVLFGSEKYNAIYDRIRYLIGLESGITSCFNIYILRKMFVSISLNIMRTQFFDGIIMLRFDETKVAKEEFLRCKNTNKNLGCQR